VSGYIKLYRQITENDLWNEKPFSPGQAWVDLLLIANYREGTINKRGNRIKVEPGQVGYSIKGLADRWGWSQGKVKRFLKHLENEEQTENRITKLTSIVTLKNWEKYNGNGEQTENRRRTDGEQTETIKKGKKGKKEKNIYGEFENVLLSDEEKEKLIERFGKTETVDVIERLSCYIESSGKKYKSHYSTILTWKRKDEDKNNHPGLDDYENMFGKGAA
jgi:hypothetical protein